MYGGSGLLQEEIEGSGGGGQQWAVHRVLRDGATLRDYFTFRPRRKVSAFGLFSELNSLR